jgi:hypothetical protein
MKRQERIKPVIEIEIIHLAYKKYKLSPYNCVKREIEKEPRCSSFFLCLLFYYSSFKRNISIKIDPHKTFIIVDNIFSNYTSLMYDVIQ